MTGSPSWRTLLVVSLAAFGLAVMNLSGSTLETMSRTSGHRCQMRIISEQSKK